MPLPSTTLEDIPPAMLSLFLFPGNLICDLAGLPPYSDHRQILRSFVNMMVWGAVTIGIALWISL